LRRLGVALNWTMAGFVAVVAVLSAWDGITEKADSSIYRSIIGSLLYISNGTRPDIAFIVSHLAQHVQSPTKGHLDAAVRVIKYLKGSENQCLYYPRSRRENIQVFTDAKYWNPNNQELRPAINGFSDADYAGCKRTGRSRSGINFFHGSSLVQWSSRKHSAVSLSTCEAELYALVDGAREGISLRRLTQEIWSSNPYVDGQNKDIVPADIRGNMEGPLHVEMNCDNSSTVQVASNPDANKAIRHVLVRYRTRHMLPDTDGA
jgi:hypothetical protein